MSEVERLEERPLAALQDRYGDSACQVLEVLAAGVRLVGALVVVDLGQSGVEAAGRSRRAIRGAGGTDAWPSTSLARRANAPAR